jgi:hypothetical protein
MHATINREGLRPILLCILMVTGLIALYGFGLVTNAYAANCTPTASTPAVSSGNGYARGAVLGGSCSGSWTGKIELRNGAGSTLSSADISGNGQRTGLQTNFAVCNGANVHTFMWINDGGTVKSDTSSAVSC